MVTVSTDATRLDIDTVHRWLSTDAYWAIGRARDVVERAVAGSLNFGAYADDRQVGYARVVTDHATFAWLRDVNGGCCGPTCPEAHVSTRDRPAWHG